MPLEGHYEPSTTQWVRDQVDLIERSGGRDGMTALGRPIILLISRGSKSGNLRKTPLMRVEHDGRYALVASLGGAPKNPTWYYNVLANPHVELQDGIVRIDMLAREV